MVGIRIDKKRTFTGEEPVAELQRRFTEELTEKMKEAALKIGCNVNELKYRVNNAGIVEIERMTGEEMIEMSLKESEHKRIRDIKKARGMDVQYPQN